MNDTLPGGAPPPFEKAETLQRGDAIGRYLVLDRLGAGGMGVVYAAYDPKLGRKVALKLLRRQTSATLDEEFCARLLREAQAMAQLSHPNVLAVHDVGTHEAGTFLAMDCMDGGTLADWVAREPRSWRELRDRFVLAGRGLAAAHAAGIVHRDFKPENVLLGVDGAVRVTDFGLARGTGAGGATGPALPAPRGLLTSSLTVAGTLVGTPAYMSPEQMESRASDARADQFSFCASLYEALYGELPFPGVEVSELLEAVRAQRIRPPRKERRVPSWLREVLLRGLKLAPEDRHPSMEALLSALLTDPTARARRRSLQAAAVLGVLALVAFGRDLQRRFAQQCTGGQLRLAGIWDPPTRAAAEAAFLATKAPYAVDAWNLASGAFDRFAATWVRLQRESCEATHVRKDQSAQLLDLKSRCLDEQLARAQAISLVLTRADEAAVKSIERAVAPLADVTLCGDAAWVSAQVKPPREELRAAVAAAQRQLEEVTALGNAAQPKRATERFAALSSSIEAIDYPPLQTWRTLVEASLALDSGDRERALSSYRAAAASAEANRDDAAAARAWLGLLNASHEASLPPELTVRLAEATEGVVARLPANEKLEAQRLRQLARMYRRDKRYDEAVRASERALALSERGGRDEVLRALLLRELGSSLREAGHYDKAMEVLQQALDATEKVNGRNHPSYANVLTAAGNLAFLANDPRAALEYHRRSQAVIETVFGREHVYFANTLVGVQISTTELERYRDSLRINDEELALREKLGLAGDLSYGRALQNRAAVLIELGLHTEAVATARRALAIYEAKFGRGHAGTSTVRENLALALSASGADAEATALARELFEERQKLLGPGHPELASVLATRAHVEARSGKPVDAAAMARTVVELHRGLPEGNLQHAIDAQELAEALLRAKDRAGAEAQLRRALTCCGLEVTKPVRAARAHLTLAGLLPAGPDKTDHCARGLALLEAAALDEERRRAAQRCVSR